MLDILIIGAGPAGLTAAIYGKRAGKDVLVLEATAYGGKIINAHKIANYPGIRDISGFDFATGLYEQAKALDAEIKYERVTAVSDEGEYKLVKTNKAEYQTRTIIIATGAKNRMLGISGEKELVGKGVSYCATCDGMFFRGRDVAVVGGGDTAIEDADFLSNYCNKVYLIHRNSEFSTENLLIRKLQERGNVEFIFDSQVEKFVSDEYGLTALILRDKTGNETEIKVSGVFIAVGLTPSNDIFSGLVELDDRGYIVAKEDCETKTSGIFVSGDCRTKTVRQLTTAAADGTVAALAAVSYISKMKKEGN